MTTPTLSVSFQLGAKGRVVLPAAVRREAGLPDRAHLVAHADGQGRIVIETREAVQARIWAATPHPVGADLVTEVREMRDADERISAGNSEARSALGDADSDAIGAAFLASLGL